MSRYQRILQDRNQIISRITKTPETPQNQRVKQQNHYFHKTNHYDTNSFRIFDDARFNKLKLPQNTHKALLIYAELEITSANGLDGRSSAKFTQLASSYRCKVRVNFKDKRRDGKEIMDIMTLQIKKEIKSSWKLSAKMKKNALMPSKHLLKICLALKNRLTNNQLSEIIERKLFKA